MKSNSIEASWGDDPDERYWVEIRWTEGIGTELRCPQTDENGNPNPWYDLVTTVEPGDVVYHWNAREHRFVGRSTVAAPFHVDSLGQRVVPLNGFEPILPLPGRAVLRCPGTVMPVRFRTR